MFFQMHLKKRHDVALSETTCQLVDISEEVCLVLRCLADGKTMEGQVREELERCFGAEVREGRSAGRCGDCGARVRPAKRRAHAAAHLPEPLHRCRLCPFASHRLTRGQISNHVRSVHRTARSSFRSWHPLIPFLLRG